MKSSAVVLAIFLLNTGIPVEQAREAYFRGVLSEKEAERCNQLLSVVGVNSAPVLVCYKGAAEMLKAKYESNPFTKLSYFNEGKDLIERSILRDPNNIELRYIRFTIQRNLPGFLNYDQDIFRDSITVAKQVRYLKDVDLKNRITNYFNRLKKGIKTE